MNQKSPADFAVWGIILLFAITFSLLALNRHAAFESNGFDLGNVNQAVWNTARGQFLGFTNMLPLTNRLALHVEPVLLLLVPFYWLGVGGPEFLLVAQAVVVALGAWPLYRIARRRLGGWGGVVIAAAYLLYPALEAAVMFDFHAVTLAPTFFLFTLDALERENLPGAAVSLGLAMACKEDMGLVAAMLGLYVGLAHRRWKPALTMAAVGVGWSLAAVFLIQPMFAPGGNIQANRYAWLFEALAQPGLIWEHLWHRAGLPAYLWGMFAPVGGLALLSPLALLPVLPSLAINLLSSHGLQWRLEEFHYAAPVAPFVFIAATQTIAKVIEARRQVSRFTFYVLRLPFRSPAPLLIVLIVASLSYHYYRGFTPLARPFRWRPVTVHQQIGAEMAAQISADLPLFAPLNLNPHVSSRRVVLQNWDDITPDDWLWLDVASLPNENGIQQYIRDELLPRYAVEWACDGYLLLKPPYSSFALLPPETCSQPRHGDWAEPFLSFARPAPGAAPQYALSVRFGDSLELTGFDVRFNRAEEAQVVTYWRALNPLPAGLSPVLFLLDESGAPAGATDARDASPTLIWLPAGQWPVGETVAVTFLRPTWETRDRRAYRLALGVTPADDPWDVGARRLLTVQQSPFAPRLLAGGTIIELARLRRVAGFSEGGPLPRQMTPPVVQRRLGVEFGGQVRLAGYDGPDVAAEAVTLRLVWQGLGAARGDWTRFAQLIGPDGSILAQHDSPPDGGAYPTSLWAEGEYVAETVVLPLDAPLPAGTYTLRAGLYNPATGQRLANDRHQDHISIAIQQE